MQSPIAITGTTIHTAVGDMPVALYGAVATHMLQAKLYDGYTVMKSNGKQEQAYVANIDTPDETGILEKLTAYLTSVLFKSLIGIPPDERVLLAIVLPPRLAERMRAFVHVDLSEFFSQNLSLAKNITVTCEHEFSGATQFLAQCCEKLSSQQTDRVLFCGVDSLVNTATLIELEQANLLFTTDAMDGLILGEAAACIVLQRCDTSNPALCLMQDIQHGVEENVVDPESSYFPELRTCMQRLLSSAQLNASDIDSILFPGASLQAGQLEWFQTKNKLWPMRASEQQRVAMMVGEIDAAIAEAPDEPEMLYSNNALGYVGAATLPINLALAAARFEFKYPAVDHIVVAEASHLPARGVVLVSNNNAD